MAITITSDNFNEYFESALKAYGANAEDSAQDGDVPLVESVDAATTTLPMVVRDAQGNPQGYKQITVQKLTIQMAQAVDPSDVLAASSVIDGAVYNSTYNRIDLLHGQTLVASIDCTNIFNAVNYYNKTQADALFDDKLDEITEAQFNEIFN